MRQVQVLVAAEVTRLKTSGRWSLLTSAATAVRWSFTAMACSVLAAEPSANQAPTDLQERGRAIIHQMVEANHYWLVDPPPTVRNYSYVLQRIGGTQEFEVNNPAKAPRPRRFGVTYSGMLQQLARAPQSVIVRSLDETEGQVRLSLAFDSKNRWAIGNGVENSWNGYHSFGGSEGYVLLDSRRWLPLETQVGKLKETFADYVQVDDWHSVPLSITLQLDDTRYDWRFRLHDPGLWLFDESFSGERRLAWIEQVKVNSAPAQLLHATQVSLERQVKAESGQDRLNAFLKANRHWLLPSLQARRGLVYEYRQEAPYLDRVLFDPEGNVMVQTEASKDSPNKPTRQKLWLASGHRITTGFGDRYVTSEPVLTDLKSLPFSVLLLDRLVQHLAMGLGWECALTRLAREPESFRAEVLPAESADQYRLVLHPRKDARLFTGTMLAFSSWAYMHDIRFDRSEILCDAATHRPLQETDYAGKDELKGEYAFENWLADSSGPAPGRIRAVVPYAKDGQDQSLEMDARFQFAKPGVWLLDRVESHFRGGGGSTGAVTVVSAAPNAFAPLQALLQKAKLTEQTLAAIQSAPEGSAAFEWQHGKWSALPLKATWSEKARTSGRRKEPESKGTPVIGICRAKAEATTTGSFRIELDGVSTAYWEEYQTEWKFALQDETGRVLATPTSNCVVRAEGTPAAFPVVLELALSPDQPASRARRIAVEGTVRRMTGAYHGHGMWYRLMNKE